MIQATRHPFVSACPHRLAQVADQVSSSGCQNRHNRLDIGQQCNSHRCIHHRSRILLPNKGERNHRRRRVNQVHTEPRRVRPSQSSSTPLQISIGAGPHSPHDSNHCVFVDVAVQSSSISLHRSDVGCVRGYKSAPYRRTGSWLAQTLKVALACHARFVCLHPPTPAIVIESITHFSPAVFPTILVDSTITIVINLVTGFCRSVGWLSVTHHSQATLGAYIGARRNTGANASGTRLPNTGKVFVRLTITVIVAFITDLLGYRSASSASITPSSIRLSQSSSRALQVSWGPSPQVPRAFRSPSSTCPSQSLSSPSQNSTLLPPCKPSSAVPSWSSTPSQTRSESRYQWYRENAQPHCSVEALV